MSRLLRNLVCVPGAAVLALATVPAASAAAAPPPRPTTTNAAKAAAGWLAQQLVHGDHLVISGFNDPGDSIGTGFALAAARVGRPTIVDVMQYVATNLDSYVDYSGQFGGPFDGGIGKAAVLAIVAGHDPNHFGGHHLLAELKAHEASDGNNKGIFSTVSTSLIAIAEARGARQDGHRFAPSRHLKHFLLMQQCRSGGFSSAVRTSAGSDCTPDVDATGYAIMALRALHHHARQINHAATWLASQRKPDGAWTVQGGENVNSTALAIAGLHIAGRSTHKSVAWLRGQQITSGPTVGAGARRGALKYQGGFDPTNSTLATNDGILGLTRADLATLTSRGATKSLPVLALARPALSKHRVARGASEHVRGTGFAASERVYVMIGSTHLGSATTNKNGSIALRVTVPTALSPGKHTLVLTGHRSRLHSRVSCTVT
jgi:hypothetical protein